MSKQIKVSVEVVEKTITAKQIFTTLTCGGCHHQEKVMGRIDMRDLPQGWYSFNLDSKGNGRVFEWLICESCAEEAKKAVGL